MDFLAYAALRQRKTITELAFEHREESDALLKTMGITVKSPRHKSNNKGNAGFKQ